MKIADYLSHGQGNGLNLRDLARLTGLHERKVRAMIAAERKAGALIVSDCKSGYFLPDSAEDVKRFHRSMVHRAAEIAAAAQAAESALAKMGDW